MQRQAAHRTQPLDSARPDRRVPRELPNLLLRLQRAPHEERSGKQRPAICERRVWGLAGAARQAPTAHTRAWRAPLSVSGNHNPQAWTQQAPQPCAPTSKALTLSSASLIALPESELQKQTKTKTRGGTDGRRIWPKRPGGSNSWEARTGAALLRAQSESFPDHCPTRARLGYPRGLRLRGVTRPNVRRPQLKSRARN